MSFHTPAEKHAHTGAEAPVSQAILKRTSDDNRKKLASGKSVDIHSVGNSFAPASIGTSSASRFGHDLSGVKLHADEFSPTLPARSAPLMVQRFPGNGEADSAPTPTAAEPGLETAPASEEVPVEESAAPGETPAAALIVENSTEELGPGQMKKSEFLAQLRAAVCRAVDAALAGTSRDTEGCPYLDYWFDFYSRQTGAHIERAIHSYAPETANVTTAGDYIPIIAERAGQAAETWARTGELTGVPEGVPTNLPGEPPVQSGGETPSSTGTLMAKARDGGPRLAQDPQSIRKELGEGHPIEGSIRSRMESAFGMDFSRVRTHTDTTAAGLSDNLNARAFTVGEHVAFGTGEYQPGTMVGDALMAHELAHVVQQGGSNSLAAKQQESTGYNMLEEDADISAVGAVASLWSDAKGEFVDFAHNAVPRLRSGLTLSRCSRQTQSVTRREVASLNLSPQGLDFIAGWEGERLDLYNDAGGHCTIGYGHLVHRGACTTDGTGSGEAEFAGGITQERARELLSADAGTAVTLIRQHVTAPMAQQEFDALVSYVFNTGSMVGTNMLRNLNQGDYTGAAREMDIVTSGGRQVRGLVNRRAAEREMFLNGDYSGRP